jgi:hypothetical protein
VTPGIAIDKCGHEIMLCQPSGPQCLPSPPSATTNPNAPGGAGKPPSVDAGATGSAGNVDRTPAANMPSQGMEGWDCGKFVHVLLCYHECQSDPVPAMGGDCDTQARCAPGAIRESYRIEVKEGKLLPARTTSRITDIIVNGSLNYAALANFVTSQSCQNGCSDCCIPLANIRIPDPGQTYDPANSIDISVRPICYTNDLLYEMILAMRPGQSQTVAGKP